MRRIGNGITPITERTHIFSPITPEEEKMVFISFLKFYVSVAILTFNIKLVE